MATISGDVQFFPKMGHLTTPEKPEHFFSSNHHEELAPLLGAAPSCSSPASRFSRPWPDEFFDDLAASGDVDFSSDKWRFEQRC